MAEGSLIEQFVASCKKIRRVGGLRRHRPSRRSAGAGRFPPLCEQLVLLYRWADGRSGFVSFAGQSRRLRPDGASRGSGERRRTQGEPDSPGFIQFGQGPDVDYDPVCFDIKPQTPRKDYRIVKLDHKEILCHHRAKVVAEIAPSFEQLVLQNNRARGLDRRIEKGRAV